MRDEHHKSNRRKLEFQTGVPGRIGGRESTSEPTLAYTHHLADSSLRPVPG